MSPLPVKMLTPSLSHMMLSQYAGNRPDILCGLIKRCAPELQISPCIPVPLERQCLLAADRCPGLKLAFIDFGQATHIVGQLPQTLGIALFQRQVQVSLNGVPRRIKAGEPLFLSPGEQIELTLPRKAQFHYIQLSSSNADDGTPAWSGFAAGANASEDSQAKQALSQALLNYLLNVKYWPSASLRRRNLDRLRWRLMDILDRLVRGKPVLRSRREHEKDPRLQRISDFIEQQRQWDYRPETLCEMATMSLRNLYYGFERDFGTTPFRFHRNCKLARVRFALLQDHAQTHPISWHATNEGFFHLSRFAGQYRQLFDELPSATVRRLQLMAEEGQAGCCGEAHNTIADCNPQSCRLWRGCSLASALEESL